MAFEPVLLTRLPESGREGLEEYTRSGGYKALGMALNALTPQAVLREVGEARLRGRGGAAFPAARKWQLAASQEADRKYVVANGGEHEPGSLKDRTLVTLHPHKVIEGLALAGYATGAHSGYVYLLADMEAAIAGMEASLEEARDAGFLGEDIFRSGFFFDVELARAPATYVAGEETAALEAIEGKAAKPRKKPPYPGESGLFGKPTTVNNVETLANVPGIIANGAPWFRALGTESSSGTMLFTLGKAVARPGVYEMPFGAPFRELIEERGGGLRNGKRVKAFLPALSCAFLPPEALDVAIDHDAVKQAGSSLGCGGLGIVAEGECLACRTADIARFFMAEQCGQCSMCRILPARRAPHRLTASRSGLGCYAAPRSIVWRCFCPRSSPGRRGPALATSPRIRPCRRGANRGRRLPIRTAAVSGVVGEIVGEAA